MSALEDLFNSPTKPPPPRSPIPSRSVTPDLPPRRPNDEQNPLFFSPGAPSEYGVGSPSRPRPRSTSPTPIVRQSVPPPGAQVNGYRTHQQGDFEDPFAALNANGQGMDDEEGEMGKRKRTVAKVDADRLTSDRGIPALCRAAKRFKVKGKGHETQDLRNLLNMYQMWAHGMFPKGDFQHTVNRVEVICRSKRMESALKGYKEAFNPPPRSPSPPPLSDRGLTPPIDQEVGEANEPLFNPRPPVQDDEDEFGPDLEEMMALEGMEREAQSQRPAPTAPPKGSGTGDGDEDGPPVIEEEDEWEGLYD
ncbi:hypothetical protein I302_100511 [Kwoniella bestiolae CBS 10118]|uniref:Chromosome segregation in meiosis protein n=1 Tax=Kwoniella bestiolae CBS 10118 TaxID=1296100 RepID=A0A1B9G5A5_9TREE|nr:hypothetical protein I302_03884 [Kwoniella bestiolae CBS 10118]OCF26205.1 hypothetical protein I302_03884 [Kwoniella bestiolae CBS 10118]